MRLREDRPRILAAFDNRARRALEGDDAKLSAARPRRGDRQPAGVIGNLNAGGCRRRAFLNEPADIDGARADGVNFAIDHDLQRVDGRTGAERLIVSPLPFGVLGRGTRIAPLAVPSDRNVVPVVDMPFQRDNVVSRDGRAEIRFGRRTR